MPGACHPSEPRRARLDGQPAVHEGYAARNLEKQGLVLTAAS